MGVGQGRMVEEESSRLVEGVSTLTQGYIHSASTFCDVFIHHLFFKLLLFSFFCAITYLISGLILSGF